MIRRVGIWVVISVWLAAMPASLERAIAKSGIPKKDISLLIRTLSGKTVASLHATAPRKPASVIKLFTVYAALRKFGFDYRFQTRLYRDGIVKHGVLYGDLYVKGYGDPTLSRKDLPDLVRLLQAKGIAKITGDIVVDRSYFQTSLHNSARFDEHPYSPYNAMPDALMFNERVSTVCIEPKTRRVSKSFPDASFTLQNKLRFVNRACKGRYAWPRVKIDDQGDRTRVLIKGELSTRCKPRKICQVVTQPHKSFYYAFKEALRRNGIAFGGRLRTAKVPYAAKPIGTHYSDRLEVIAAKTLKKSNNLYARHLFLALGARMFGAPATLQKARRALRLMLRQDGIATQGLFVDNGSGLSRRSRLTVRHLIDLLDTAHRRYGTRWMKLLAIAGVDGTIKRRFRGTVVAKRAWMKTGTLKHAKNIAGYVKARNGVLYEVAIVINTLKPRYKAARLEDRIIEGLVRLKGYDRGMKTAVQSPRSIVRNDTKKDRDYFVQIGTFTACPKPSYGDALRSTGLRLRYRREPTECKAVVGPFENETQARKILPQIKKRYPGAFLTYR